jgi:2-succinyl-5-enolpyruvyl-6-hydroxy-3-cyclohexene-1-carboxylate synthase
MPARNRNELWARTLLDELARAGVRHVVVSPGSRSAPLVLAVAADARFRTAVQVDERSAGFLALGVGKGTGHPAAVITTSGTAVANLLPAVVEAAQSEVPLLLLTADRPPRLRGADANQAIEQPGIFGSYVRLFQELSPAEVSDRALRHLRGVANRAVAAAVGAPAGPVHLNLAFEKPLEPVAVPGDLPAGLEEAAPLAMAGRGNGEPFTRIHPRRVMPAHPVLHDLARRLRDAERPVIVAGPTPRPFESGEAVIELARSLGVPLLADPLSGARTAELPGHAYDLALRVAGVREALAPDLVLRFGRTPSSASLATWLDELRAVPQVVVDGGDGWKDHLAVASEVVPGDAEGVAQALQAEISGSVAEAGPWSATFARIDARVADAVAPALQADFFEGAAAVEAARTAQVLFVSNSMPVRDVDALVPCGLGGDGAPLRILGNRGASGIDGIVSTALGVAWGAGVRVTALIGDLALVHDMNGLLRARDLDGDRGPCRVDFVVVNNDGGGIFHLLPVRDHEPHFTRFVATPHGLEPERIAALHRLPFRKVEGRGTPAEGGEPGAPEGPRASAAPPAPSASPGASARIREALDWAREQDGSVILEIRTDRDENRRRHAEMVERVRTALTETSLTGS